ncbi:inositol monophosphatase family protein [Oscillatoria sp. CS-180]|uniref:inositol monophosphatase family protein n=1 Tax=Oscillatoria sp. CS-180 TaxID=3021720 RepID=UPI00232BB052|nr:inositol monophosphatase family protein [Oscillatoria sp. CS-180]MDB9528055.1 inositol monophosphatase family protein [Oscillatoria sp. CS-180]
MSATPTPRQILETLLPPLRMAAGYSRHIQAKIAAQPAKEGPNKFSMALTDADLSVQTFVEVALLGSFPNIRFYGEEYEQSYNTKYFRAINLGPEGDYLVTLDPIDGTLFYMDGFPNYQIIVTVLNADGFEAVLAMSPAEDSYYMAFRGKGTHVGRLDQDLDACQPLEIASSNAPIFLGTRIAPLKSKLSDRYEVISVSEDYSPDVPIPNVNGVLKGQLAGVILAAGKFIDGGALSFLAQEAGCIVTDHQGQRLPRLDQCTDYALPGVAIATSPALHSDLITALDGFQY